MKIVFKIILQILLLFFPWIVRRRLLIYFFGFELDSKSKIGLSIFLCDELILYPNATIGHLTFCKNINSVVVGRKSGIGSLNFITGFNTKNKSVFSHRTNRKCELIIEEHSDITSRHFLDCNGGIYIGKFTTIAGIRSTFLTHSIDIYKNRQDVKPIYVGDYCFVGTGCILLGGSKLPSYSVLGAGAVLTTDYLDINFLYAGVPAKPIKKLKEILYFKRKKGAVS